MSAIILTAEEIIDKIGEGLAPEFRFVSYVEYNNLERQNAELRAKADAYRKLSAEIVGRLHNSNFLTKITGGTPRPALTIGQANLLQELLHFSEQLLPKNKESWIAPDEDNLQPKFTGIQETVVKEVSRWMATHGLSPEDCEIAYDEVNAKMVFKLKSNVLMRFKKG
jgi:hypothetical protein